MVGFRKTGRKLFKKTGRKLFKKTGRKTFKKRARKMFGGAPEYMQDKGDLDKSMGWANTWQVCHKESKGKNGCLIIKGEPITVNDKRLLEVAVKDKQYEVNAANLYRPQINRKMY